jgi:hypothetical protein
MNKESQDPLDDEDGEAWIARLRAARTAEPTAANEEDRAMYQVIMRQHREEEAELLKDAQSDDHAWQQMRFRLKREGLLQTTSAWTTWVPVAMAAAVLAAVALPMLMAPGIDVLDSEPAVLRGGGQRFQVEDPLKVAKAVAKELKPNDPGLKLHWYRSVATIDTDLKAADLDRAEAILRSKVPAGKEVRLQLGFNRLEFSAAP